MPNKHCIKQLSNTRNKGVTTDGKACGSHFQERLVRHFLFSRDHHNGWKRHHAANILGEQDRVNNGNMPCNILHYITRNQVKKVERLEGYEHVKE